MNYFWRKIVSILSLFLYYTFVYLLGGKKIQFSIIGGQKCGTTSLASFLKIHPDCSSLQGGKEPRFFSKFYIENNLTWRLMQNMFPRRKIFDRNYLFFDATTEYCYLEEVPERIYKYNPKMKLIFMVREPVGRAFSEYMMDYNYAQVNRLFWEDPEGEYMSRLKDAEHYPFSWFIDEELRKIEETGSVSSSAFQYPDFLRRGIYSIQLERYYRYFKPEQILILEDKELKQDRKQTLYRIEEFLEIPHIDWPDDALADKNIGKYHFSFPENCRSKLNEFFAPWNERFFEMIGRRMDWGK
ncbi:sulfotransferase domain-containing protein [Parabacteroides bouchesdurhonensis]|uniref:sulfotransferase domain-containing protein n=1 Tax=Parabacteroides bouchesdurhonensis TaxID=1936995 RepID=UPI000C81F90A|nr:sulfotransferase domain-containing protein [Parabacteroides bouchesdurhonensis]